MAELTEAQLAAINDAVTGLYETSQRNRAHALRVVTNALVAEVAALRESLTATAEASGAWCAQAKAVEAEVAALREERDKLDNTLWSAAFLLGRLDTLEEVTTERDAANTRLAEATAAICSKHGRECICVWCEEARRALGDGTGE